MANAEISPEELQRQLDSNLEQQRHLEEHNKSILEQLSEARKRTSQPREHKRLHDADAGRRATAAMPRSLSNTGYSMNRGVDRMQRSVSLHSAPAHAMCRSVSSAVLESQVPFTQAGRVGTFANVGTAMMLNHYIHSNDEAVNAQMAAMANRLSPVEEDPLAGVGQDPADYIAQMGEDYSTFSSPPQGQFLSASNDFYHVPSATPSLVSGTTAAEAVPLSRQNSGYDAASVGGPEMTRIGSGHSQRAESLFGQDFSGEYSLQSKSSQSAALIGVGIGACMGLESADMSRSISSSSTSSKCSIGSNQEKRAKEARERQIENGKRTQIAPKPEDITKPSSRSQSEAEKDGKLALSKNTYQRPVHARVFCTQCRDYPEGFRGEHELRRHTNAKHEKKVKKFICRDPATVGIVSGVRIVNPLNRCKQCVQKKQYGAYYNAAAHLRRTHFKPRLGRNKSKPSEAEKRAGKAGGDWPAMSELKNWMEEVEVFANDDQPVDGSTEADDEAKGVPFIDTIDAFDPEPFSSLDAASSPASILSSQGMAMPNSTAAFEYCTPLTPTSPVMSQVTSDLGFDYTYQPDMSNGIEASSYTLFFAN